MQYAWSKLTAVRANWSRFGVCATASPLNPRADGVCWSDIRMRTLRGLFESPVFGGGFSDAKLRTVEAGPKVPAVTAAPVFKKSRREIFPTSPQSFQCPQPSRVTAHSLCPTAVCSDLAQCAQVLRFEAQLTSAVLESCEWLFFPTLNGQRDDVREPTTSRLLEACGCGVHPP